VPGEEVVMLSQVIAHSCNIGYEMNKNLQLKSFNSVSIKNLKHLKDLIDAFSEEEMKMKAEKEGVKEGEKGSKISKKKASSSVPSDGVASAMLFEFTNDQVVVLDGSDAVDAKDQVRSHLLLRFL
jgi:hypothetical protein